ncbi:hypothetical protein OXX80_011996, partial [Metschnikowia pulcherrima]
ADFKLESPFKARRSARLWSLSDSANATKSIVEKDYLTDLEIKHETAEVKVEYEEASMKSQPTIRKTKIDLKSFVCTEEPLTPRPHIPKIVKNEPTAQALPPTPMSESPKLTPKSENTFYTQIGSNVFQPVHPQDVTARQPKNWDKIYNEIAKMRALIHTPVDSFGCERLPDSITPGMSSVDPKTYRFQLLISLMLSAQTKDETNFAAMKTLQQHFVQKGYPGICLEESSILSTRKSTCSCDILKERFGGEIPKTIEEIVTLPGVGPKMGHLILQNGWSINSGIGVDVHIHRLAQMWGWVPKSEKPELTRNTLEGWLPKKYWADINPLLVGFGQTVCAPKANNCDICYLANGLCKGVNRKLANTKLSDKRVQKLGRSRGDMSGLVSQKLANLEM